jgi:hypothetical protein
MKSARAAESGLGVEAWGLSQAGWRGADAEAT